MKRVCFSPRQQKPERTDLDGKESAQKSEGGRLDPDRGLFFREKPPVKPSDEKRHGQKGRSGHTNDVTNEGRQRSVEAKGAKNWAEKAHFEHHDRKQSQHYEKGGLPVWRPFAGDRVDRYPAR